MKHLACPHCGNTRLGGNRIPKDVVVVLPCPTCHELVVVFRNKTAAANREILENGSNEQRKAHIAEIVMEFLDSLIFRSFPAESSRKEKEAEGGEDDPVADDMETEDSSSNRITQREVDRFVKLELQRIDDSSYFKKHFK